MRKWKGLCIGILTAAAVVLFGAQTTMTSYAGTTEVNVSNISKDYKIEKNDKGNVHYFFGTSKKHSIIVDCSGSVEIHLQGVNINDDDKAGVRIKKGSHVTLYVEGSNYLYGGDSQAGLQVDEGASVTILGNGELEAIGSGKKDHGAAGIGSANDESCGKITIGDNKNSPKITAKSGDGGAGIGSGEDGRCDDGIYINNGNITATGTNGGAGIGGGDAVGAGDGGKTKTIVISGGTVKATGSSGAAGIGGSDRGSSGSGGDVSDITISGGTVTATGGSEGAGIGGGEDGYAENITISGGNITAKGGKYAAGIGGGNAIAEGDGGDIKNLKITGGTIKATGGESAAGIGGGDQSEVKNLKIEEASSGSLKITAQGGKWGAGIGNGNSGVVSKNIDSIYIKLNGGTITATGGSQGAGIGGGNSTAKKIEIYGRGTINATGYDESCGIGAGESEDGGTIIIEGNAGSRSLIINAQAAKNEGDNDAAAIGAADAKCGDITIKNAEVYIVNVDGCFAAGIGSANNHETVTETASDITIENCYVKDKTWNIRNAASIGGGISSSVDNITIKNSEVYGGAIGSSDNYNQAIEPTIDCITIEGSTIEAERSNGQGAAIGSGRYDGIKKIVINNSDITAKTASGAAIGSGGYASTSSGDTLRWTGGECGDVYITNSVVTAKGADGGAGIGGGWGTPAGHIMISSSTITATGGIRTTDGATQGGAGIGGGHGESLEYISIKDNSTITAVGGGSAAGIGSGGKDSFFTTIWNTSCGYIYMENSKVTATGGNKAAGIGTGEGAQFTEAGSICIKNCEVLAQGGEYGAGIGAGADAAAGSGGEAHDIVISGRSKVTATGGKRGAGIGGGCDGGCEEVRISLNDTKYSNGDWVYYVKATGGSGAAGIGSGGVVAEDETFTQNGHDIDQVTINGGYVYAQGGADDFGAGAGIGGGARGGNLNGFEVTGGYVEAHAGYADSYSKAKADDIGTGGDDGRPAHEDENFEITGGTVIGGLSSDPDKIIIDGGSVSHICVGEDDKPNAERSDGTKVYRTLLKAEEPYYELQDLKTSLNGYGTTDVISDGGGTVYLYLPQSAQDQSTADFKVNGASKHYYGTTKTDGNGWLKMGLVTTFKEPTGDNVPVAGGEFVMELNDSTLTGKTTFDVSGNAELRSDESVNSPGAKATLYGKDFGEFTIKATNAGNEMYWSATAEYTGRITNKAGTLTITEDPTKVFDGEPVEDPAIEFEGDGKITYAYYRGAVNEANRLTEKPVNAGNYTVVVKMEDTDKYRGCEAQKTFNIIQRPVTLAMTALQEGTAATVKVEALNAVSADGKITFEVKKDDKYLETFTEEIEAENGKYIAQIEFDRVSSADYTITASYSEGENHECNSSISQTYGKDKAIRTVTAEDITATYGDDAKTILPSASTDPANSANDTYKYEVVTDSFDAYGLEKTITVSESTGTVTFQNAGKATVKVTLSDGSGVYEDAVTYVTVTVKRKPIAVSSYAYQKSDATKNPVNTVVYGQLDTLEYDLKYGDSTSEPTDFAIGTLKAVPPNKTLGVNSDARIAIAKVGEKVTINGNEYDNVFVSRNYDITYSPTKITITKAPLTIDANDAASEYGIAPEYTCTMNDLMPWDSADDVIESIGPAGKSYTDLAPGTYKDKIVVTAKANPNYTITETPADLTIKKGSVDLHAEISSKVYDGMPNEAAAVAEPVTSEGITAAMLKDPSGDMKVEYFKIDKEDKLTELKSAPAEPGYYVVKAAIAQNNYYEEAATLQFFRIKKASLLVEVRPEIKSYDGKPVETAVSSTPITSDAAAIDQMEAPGEAVLTYYKVEKVEEGITLTKLTSAPVNAGSYLVTAEVAESDCYEAASGENYFRIYKARYEIDAPEVPDILMRDGLTLADQKLPDRWAWVKPSTKLSVGEVSAYAVYTPEDTENYFNAFRKVAFTVYEKGSGDDGNSPGDGTNDGTNDGTANGTGGGSNDSTGGGGAGSENTALDTGDNTPILLFMILLIVSGMAIVGTKDK